MSKEDVVLSFHDSLLRKSDIDILRGNDWLNDTLISFYFEYLDKVMYKDENSLLFIPPEVTQCLKMIGGRHFGEFLDPLEFQSKDFVFFALNDNHSVVNTGGSHWSVLVYSKPESTFYHFDSMNDCNLEEAEILYNNFMLYLNTKPNIGKLKLTSLETVQQNNSYDCGIHVLCNIDVTAPHVLKNKRVRPNHPLIEASSVRNKRLVLINLIEKLANQK